MTALPTLKLRVLPTFPASVTGAGAITVTKLAGAYTIGFSQDVALTWTQSHVFNPTNGDAITIAPKVNSTNRSIVSTQSTPTSGTVAGPFALNLWNITYSTRVTGSGSDATGNSNVGAVGFRVNQNITTAGVASTSAPIITGLFTATVSTTTAITDVTGLAGTAYTNVAMSGVYLEGMNAVAHVGPTGSANILVGLDTGAYIETGGTATYRFGISVLSGGNVNGTTNDAAIVFNSNTTTKFTNIFLFSNFSSTAPIGASTSVFKADTAYPIANFANLPTMSVSGYILQFDKIGLSGDGRMIIGGVSNTVLALPIVLTAQVASGGRVTLNSMANGTTGLSGLDVLSSTGAAEAFVYANEPARTAVRFGQAAGSWAEIGSIGGNGLLFGTEDSTPLIIGTNNTNRMHVTAAGLVNIGTYVAPLATLTVNKNAAAPAAAVSASSIFQAVAADSVEPVMMVDGFGTGNIQPFITIRRGRGTGASFTAVLNGDALGYFGMVGATGANTFASETSAGGTTGGVFFGAAATENWSGTNQGAELKLYATPTGSLAIVQGMGVNSGVIIGAPTGSYKGLGTLNAATAYYTNGSQVVGARITGYTAMTGSPDKVTAYATGSVTLAQLAGRVAQLQADLTTHGLIGT